MKSYDVKWYEYIWMVPFFLFTQVWLYAVLLIVGLCTLLVLAGIFSQKKWSQFVKDHDCKIVGRLSGELITTTTISPDGKLGTGIMTTPDKTGWACNDGVTYWR